MHHNQPAKHLRSLSTLLAFVLLASVGVSTGLAAGIPAQRIVAQKTVEALPDPLSEYFNSMQDALIERSIEPFGLWRRIPRFKSRTQWYFVHLDVTASSNDQVSRDEAANAFPTERTAANRLMAEHGVKRGGRLPWVLERLTKDLSEAFTERDRDAITERAGHLVAFCTCAANPFHVTRNRRGAESGNPVFADASMGDPLYAHQDVAKRFGWELVRRNATRYAKSVDTETFRYALEQDARAAIFETMLDSLDTLSTICEADRTVLERMKINDGASFLERRDEYYELVDGVCGEEAVAMLSRASRLSVALIYDAYKQAGSPDLTGKPIDPASQTTAEIASSSGSTDDTPSAAPSKEATPQPEPKAIDETRVASKRSKVYHRPTCNHVKRISDKNRVEYPDLDAAKASGKRACKACGADGTD